MFLMQMMLCAVFTLLVMVPVEGSATISQFLPGELADDSEEFTIIDTVGSVKSSTMCSVWAM